MVGRYAAFCTHVAMTCKRHGDARPDVSTPGGPGATRLDAIRAVYGAAVARELLPLELAVGDSVGPEVAVDDPLALRLEVRARVCACVCVCSCVYVCGVLVRECATGGEGGGEGRSEDVAGVCIIISEGRG